MADSDQPVLLNRVVTLPMLVLYGLGTTIGAGIYALTGVVADLAGYAAPLSFLGAVVLAGFTALSFSELCARYPRAAGEAAYVAAGFNSQTMGTAVGLLVVLTGIVSSAALTNAFVGYGAELFDLPRWVVIVVTTLVITAVAIWGVGESIWIAGIMTIVEVLGLLLVLWAVRDGLATFPAHATEIIPAPNFAAWAGVYAGAILAFYAFIGFEDMVNLAEEVKDVQRNMPIGIILTLAISGVLYISLLTGAVFTIPPHILAESDAPLALLYSHNNPNNGMLLAVIGIIAIANGILIQVIMASRVLYGLAQRGSIPKLLGAVHIRTRTPHMASLAAGAVVLVLALMGELTGLAKTTSLLMLVIFFLVNVALWRVQAREPTPDIPYRFPRWVPALGAVASAAVVISEMVNFVF